MPMGYKPIEGFTYNPLLSLPRNMFCPCESGKKFKSCHLPTMPRYVTHELAAEYSKSIKSVGDNVKRIRFTEDAEKCLIERKEVLA